MDHPKLLAPFDLCNTIVFTNGSGSTITSGTWRVEGEVLGMVVQDVEDGEDGVMLVDVPPPGILIPVEGTTVDLIVGEHAYWDVADGELNDDSAANADVGYALEAAVAGDAEVRFRLLNAAPVA